MLGRILEALEAAQGVVIAMRKKTWNRYTGIGLLSAATALAVVSATPAGADDVQAASIPVPAEEPEAQEGEPEVPDPSSWDAQRRIPAMSPFVNGTGFWGPSNKPGYD